MTPDVGRAGVFSSQKLIPNRLANLLGLQVFRIVLARRYSRLRRKCQPPITDPNELSLLFNGFCVIPDFLPDETFLRVRDEYHRTLASGETQKKVIRDSSDYIRETVYVSPDSRTPEAFDAIYTNATLQALLLTPEALPPSSFSQGEFQVAFWRSYPDPKRCVSAIQASHTNSELHSDTFHTIAKAFFYIEPVTVSNGAHRYVPHSHRLSLGRLRFEYWNSIVQRNESPRVSDEQLKTMKLAALDFDLPANTLIVENTFGFHAAGGIQPGQQRDLIYIQLRWPPFTSPRANTPATTTDNSV